MKTKTISELHLEHEEWLESLNFYTDEISILTRRLEDISTQKNSHEVKAEIEHFQNQFILQKEKLDELRHRIKDHENYLEHRVDENPVQSDVRKVNDHPKMRDEMTAFEKLFADLRRDFNTFQESAA